jgi:hypothetical protein
LETNSIISLFTVIFIDPLFIRSTMQMLTGE